MPLIQVDEGQKLSIDGPATVIIKANTNLPMMEYNTPAPSLASLSPPSADLGSADIEMKCIGTGFTPKSVIVFNNNDEPTDFYSDTEIGTGVKPSIFTVAEDLPVFVRTGDRQTEPVMFTFTDPAEAEAEAARRKGHGHKGHR